MYEAQTAVPETVIVKSYLCKFDYQLLPQFI